MSKLICIVLINLVVLGCYTKPLNMGTGGPRPGVDVPDPRVVMSLTLSNEFVSTSHPVELTIEVKNIGNERLQVGHGSSSCPLRCIVIVEDHEYLALDSRICTADESPILLNPGGSIRQTLVWDGRVLDEQPRALAPGIYRLVGVTGRLYRSEPSTIEVRAE